MSAPNDIPSTASPVKLAAIIGALGIVFGDIGTSPLYAFKEPLRVAMEGGVPFYQAVLGVLSLIFWALTLTISVKYVLFILRADNEGEGGVLALVTSLRLHKKETAGTLNKWLLIAGLAGAAMLFGDGVLTPAISVLSAVEGLQVVAPSLQGHVLQITIAVLIGIFMSQRFGTEKIGVFYGPIVLAWFVAIGALGIHGILQAPDVLQAANPYYALSLIGTHPGMAILIIGAVFLAVTGGEALYADLGHFGHKVITRAWFFAAMPGLLLNYFGQGALVIAKQGVVHNSFYELAPEWFGFPLLILATLATVVAAQAIITGAFSLARQLIEIGYFPPMRQRGTSKINIQHIFISRLNTALMCVTLLVVMIFPSSSELASAYGIAVSFAMMTTTLLFMAWMLRRSSWPRPVVMALCLLFLLMDMTFFSTNLVKFMDGGWLPIMMGAGIMIAMASWSRGLKTVIERHLGYTEPIEDFAARVSGAPLALIERTGIFFSRTGIMAPVPLERITNMLHIRFERIVIVSIRIASRPRVMAEDRVQVMKVDGRTLKIEVRYGYLQNINIPATIGPALREQGIDAEEALYIIGHERVIAPSEPGSLGDLMDVIFGFLAATAERAVDRFQLPASRTIEMGYPIYL